MSLGPMMIGVPGLELDRSSRELLEHPAVGGVVLFARNYHDVAQVTALIEAIHAVRTPRLLVAVDHEGGRVQRFRDGFTRLPAAARIGDAFDRDPERGRAMAHACGLVLGAELRAVGVDFSFCPVLDLRSPRSSVIGDRAFHRDPEVVATLARDLERGLGRAGMPAVGKHFPGHGTVEGDSHHVLPCDRRGIDALTPEDLVPFLRLMHQGLPAIMPALVVFEPVDAAPVCLSRAWITGYLRGRLDFRGAVFSDDLGMVAAEAGGSPPERIALALDAGCDVALACNLAEETGAALDAIGPRPDSVRSARLVRMHGRCGEIGTAHREYARAVADISMLDPEPELPLGDDAPA